MLQLLVIEDVEADFRLIERQLHRGGFDARCRWVAVADEIAAAIDEGGWSAVLSDYSLPGIEFATILARVQSRLPNVPVILVSGNLGDEAAVEMLKMGVADFVLKDRLARLVPAIERSLAEAGERAARQEAERALIESERRYGYALAATREGLWDWDVVADTVHHNSQWFHLMGLPEDGGRHPLAQFASMVHQDDRADVLDAIRDCLGGHGPYRSEHRRWRADGELIWVLDRGDVVERDPHGKPLRMVGSFSDISVRKEAELALADEIDQRKMLFEQSRDGIVIIDENGKVFQANQRFAEMLGYSMAEVRELHVWDWDDVLTREELETAIREIDAAGDHFETRHRRKDGSLCEVEISSNGACWGGHKLIFCVCHDVTERNTAAAALRRREQELAAVLRAAPVGIGVATNRVIGETNNYLRQLIGYSDEEIRGLASRILYESDAEYQRVGRELLSHTGAGTSAVETRWRHKNGDAVDVLLNSSFLDADKPDRGLVVTALNITARKRAEAGMRQKERYQRALLDNFPFAVWLKDTESRFLAVNQAFARVFGALSSDALVGKTDFDIAPLDMAEAYRADDRRILASRQMRMVEEEIIDQGVRKWFETYKAPVIDEGGNLLGTVGFARDVSDRRQAEAALAESEARFRKLFEDSAEAVLLIEDGVFVDANRAALEMLRVETLDRLVGRSPDAFSPPCQPDGRSSVEAAKAFLQRSTGEGALQFEWMHSRADGEPFVAEVLLTPILHETRRLIHVVWRDISERKRMETALRESEFFLKESQKIGRMGGWRADPRTNSLMWTEGVYAVVEMPLDYKPNLESGLDFYPPHSRERVVKNLNRILETGEPFAIETELRSGKGQDLWVELRGFAQREGGRIAYLVGTIQDITPRKLLDAALRESEARANLILDTAPEAMLVIDAAGKVILANVRADRVFGYAPGEMLGLDVERLMPERFRNAHAGHRRSFAERPRSRPMGVGLDLCARRRDGREFPIEVGLGSLRVGGQSLVIVSVLDISPRKQAEADLRESQRFLHQAQAIAHVGSWVADLEAGTFSFSDEGARLVGWTPGLHAAADLLPYFHPEDLLRVQATWRKGLKSGLYEIEHRIIVDGSVRWLVVKGEFAYNASGRAIRAVGMTQDITEIREAQQALEAHREHLEELVAQRTAELNQQARYLRALVDNVPHPVWLKDSAGHYLVSNRTNAVACGCALEEMVGATDFDLWPLDLAERYRADDVEVMKSGQRRIVEEPLADAVKGTIWIETCKTPVLDETGSVVGTAGFARDVSEQKATEAAREAALREAQRLAEVRSEFLANMSHEIRTPLNAVLGLAQVGERESPGRKAEDNFRRIREAGQLLLGIVNDILDFSKIEAGKLQLDESPFHLGDAIDRAVDVTAERAYAKGINFLVRESADLPVTCVGDALRVSQILVNLLSNAVKFTERGRVRLSTQRIGSILGLRVEDTGVGISPAQLGRLFLPFEQADGSTTRRYGGTGLGLAISKRLAELMGGEILVSSQLGQGSVFELRLPLRSVDDPRFAAGSRVVLAGLPDAEALADELAERGADVLTAPFARAFEQAADLVLVDSASLAQDRSTQDIMAAVERGQRVALAVTPGSPLLSGGYCEGLRSLQRPLRARHVLAALGGAIESVPDSPRSMRLLGVRVLAAEDNEVNRLVLTEMLESEGAGLVCVEDGQLAVERIRQGAAQSWDVVLMDIQMPVMDGYEAARRILDLVPGLPVIGLTAHAMAEERGRCLAAGMVEHLAKPIELDHLVATILHVLGGPVVGANVRPQAVAYGGAAGLIDWTAVEARFKGKRDFVRRLAANMVQTHADSPARLREAAAAGDLESIAFLAHSIKGMAGNLLAQTVQELAAQTDLAARSGAAETAERARRLADAFDNMLAEMAARVASA
ncbi:MAG: PAS domain S-box protein [Rhodocyclaceae bacterium]